MIIALIMKLPAFRPAFVNENILFNIISLPRYLGGR